MTKINQDLLTSKNKAEKSKMADAATSHKEMTSLDKKKIEDGIKKGKSNGDTTGKIRIQLDKRTVIFAKDENAIENMENLIKQNKNR